MLIGTWTRCVLNHGWPRSQQDAHELLRTLLAALADEREATRKRGDSAVATRIGWGVVGGLMNHSLKYNS